MWYSLPESTKHYPLSIESVKKIQEQNRQGIKPEALETVEIVSGRPKEVEPEFVDVVGHITLRSLEKNNRRNNNRNKNNRPTGQQQNTQQQNTQQQGTQQKNQQQKSQPQKNQQQKQQNNQNNNKSHPKRNRPPGKKDR